MTIAAIAPLLAGWSTSSRLSTASRPSLAGPGQDRLLAVAATSGSDAWAVGSRFVEANGGVILTLTEHWDGKTWSMVPSPSPAGTGPGAESILRGIAATSPSDAWAVGNTAAPRSPAVHPLVEHWNGTRWSVVHSPALRCRSCGLSAVAALSPANVWAVGSRGTSKDETLIVHWNGSAWQRVPSPNPAGASDLLGVAAISPTDVWAAGGTLTPKLKVHTLIEHWNGVQWTIVPSPNATSGHSRHSGLFAIDASSRTSIWAVGEFQSGPASVDQSTLVEHWGGARWRIQASPNASPLENTLDGVAALSRRNAWAVGTFQSNHGPHTLIEHWNGTRWRTVPGPALNAISVSLSGVAAVSASRAWAVGEVVPATSHQPQTLIEQWNGTRWQRVPSPSP